MFLSDLIHESEILSAEKPVGDFPVGFPVSDSRRIFPGDLFFCMTGAKESGFSYLGEAISAGASAIIHDSLHDNVFSSSARLGVPVIRVADVRAAYATAWRRLTDEPQRSMRLAAVTGTNGKTSVMTFLSSLLRASGQTIGGIGTVGSYDGCRAMPADFTTPPPDLLYPLLSRMRGNGVGIVVMEASSHALSQKRLDGLCFALGIFTNLTRDHLDYHKTFEEYRAAKETLFRACRISLLHRDDAAALSMGFAASGDVYYYSSLEPNAEFYFHDLHTHANGTDLTLDVFGKPYRVFLPLIGEFHAENAVAAISGAILLGIPAEEAVAHASLLEAPCGRLEKLPTNTDFSVYIDFAHTPDALEKALFALRPLTDRLTVLFGAGGDRDRGKRPQMGHVAETIADRVILTSDNPRSEKPEAILDEIAAGMTEQTPILLPDRKEAIAYALRTARAGEIVLLAGKGHERTMTDAHGKHPFSEPDIVSELLSNQDDNESGTPLS